jgi:ATP-binding cassette, subfamily B, vacuolar membrane transporter HMT1/ACLQ
LQVYIVGAFFVYTLLAISIFDQKPSPAAAHISSWVVGILMEVALLGGYLAEYPKSGDIDIWHQSELVIAAVRLIILLGLLALYALLAPALARRSSVSAYTTGESSPLLPNEGSNLNGSANGHARSTSYGTADGPVQPLKEEEDEPGWARPQKAPRRTWWEYLRGYSVFFPYLWPSKDGKLQLLFCACFLVVLIQRGTNLLVPLQVGVVIDDLTGEGDGLVTVPWGPICLYILFRLLQGSNGLLNALRSWMWIPINQYSYRELAVASFEHVHSLSLDFHTGKKTGEVVSALGKGNAINTFLEQVTFQFLPMIVDLVVAIGYFLWIFDAYFALVVTIVTFWYIYLTIRLAQWRVDLRRDMTNADREQDAIK